jgi:1,4-alpha-glucan branching enzyme
MTTPPAPPNILGETDLYLFAEGTHLRSWELLGAHLVTVDGEPGTAFAVWAPNARGVSVVGDFNGWERGVTPLRLRPEAGVWEGFVPGVEAGARYKFSVAGADGRSYYEKADPYAFYAEQRPRSASVVWDIGGYEWGDDAWLAERGERARLNAPVAIYELHLGSWMRAADGGWLSYRELADRLVAYVSELGFTHVELLPVAEHALDESWGYQTLGYFAPTSRFGTPQDFMFMVDQLHQAGIGVILDWVPSHFATDPHGLGRFDGTHLYEHADPRLGWHPDWKSAIFNYGRNEVRSFLLSSAMFWLDRYHVDGLRVDAVASMLYLDYSRAPGEWIPNIHGGNENLEAIAFLRDLNRAAYGEMPGVVTVAEESTAWPGVSRAVDAGGLGFGFKWDMGWMHDTLSYFQHDPIHRAYHQDELTFRGLYQYDENFVLSLSHDEVVHGKGSLVNKMPGDEWQQFANLRALLAYMWALPGKKLLFMGCEFGQRSEWSVDRGLDWWVLEHPNHTGIQRLVSDLNALYAAEPALWAMDYDKAGFAWVDAGDAAASVLSWLRTDGDDTMLAVVNLTPLARKACRVGVDGGAWEVVLNTDAKAYWGSGAGSTGMVEAQPEPTHGRSHSVALDLPPLGVLYLKAAV